MNQKNNNNRALADTIVSMQCDNAHAWVNNLGNKNTNTNDVINRWWFVILRMFADWWYTIRSSDIIALITIIIIYKPQSVKVNDIQQYDEITCAIANKWIVDILHTAWLCRHNSKEVKSMLLYTNNIIAYNGACVQ